MLSCPPFERRFLGGGPTPTWLPGSRATAAAGGLSSNSRSPCPVPPPLAAILALPFMTGFAARVRVAPAGRREIPITFALGREAGRGLETARSGRLAFAAGRFARFALRRALGGDFDARFGRFWAYAPFLIFFVPFGLAFLLVR